MCPQKWKASLFSGSTAAATAAPPVAARTAPPIRPRKERLVMPDARRVESERAALSMRGSGRRMFHPRAAERYETVELLERVDGSLGCDEPVDHVNEERGAGHAPDLEDLGFLVLVHGPDRHALPLEGPNAGRDGAAEPTVRAEEGDELLADPVQAQELRRLLPPRRSLLLQLERHPRAEPCGQDSPLPVEGENEHRQGEDGDGEKGKGRNDERRPGRRLDVHIREGTEGREPGEEKRAGEQEVGAPLLRPEAATPNPREPAGAGTGECGHEQGAERRGGNRCARNAREQEDAHCELGSRERGKRGSAPPDRNPVGAEERRVARDELGRARPKEGDRDDQPGNEVER